MDKNTLILIRGVPGSGKSTLAHYLEQSCARDIVRCEADMFFTDELGRYNFDRSKLKEAHQWCQKATSVALLDDRDVIVSNTFTKVWEMKWYIDKAKELGCNLQVIHCQGDFGNIHGVPDEVVKRMKEQFEEYVIT